MHACEDAGDGQRVRHIRFAASASLAIVCLLGVVVGTTHLLRLIQRQVIGNQLLK